MDGYLNSSAPRAVREECALSTVAFGPALVMGLLDMPQHTHCWAALGVQGDIFSIHNRSI